MTAESKSQTTNPAGKPRITEQVSRQTFMRDLKKAAGRKPDPAPSKPAPKS